jgi:hypothetical protein
MGVARATGGGVGSRHPRSTLIVGQLAASIVLLVVALLAARGFVRLLHTDLGVQSQSVITAQLNLSLGRTLTTARLREMAADLEAALARIPGLEAPALGSALPPNGLYLRTVLPIVDRASGRAVDLWLSVVPVTPGYFAALGIPQFSGRLLTEADTADAPRVALISHGGAQRLFNGRDSLGQTLPVGEEDATGTRSPVTIVGVVGDVRYAEAVAHRLRGGANDREYRRREPCDRQHDSQRGPAGQRWTGAHA